MYATCVRGSRDWDTSPYPRHGLPTSRDCELRARALPCLASSRAPQPGVDEIAQSVAKKIEAEHREQNSEAGERHSPPGLRQVFPALGDSQTPVGIRRRSADAEETQNR